MKRSDPSQRPGVMLYFDLEPSVKRLNLEEKGRLLEAILDYAQWAVHPDFEGSLALELVWDFVRPRIDRDGERYERAVLQKHYAVYSRTEKKFGREPMGFEEWLELDQEERQRPLTAVDGREPTTTPNTNTTSSSAPATAANSPPASTSNPADILQFTAPGAGEEGKLSPRQRELDFEARRRERILEVMNWKG